MNIKPDRSGGPLPLSGNNGTQNPSPKSPFSLPQPPGTGAGKDQVQRKAFDAIADRFSRADLNNPAQTESLIHAAVEELVRQECSHLPAQDRAAVAGRMQTDPLLRDRILQYFGKILQ